VLAVFLIVLFSFILPIFPTGGWNSPKDWVLPTVTLALAPMGIIARFTRSSMLEVIRSDYIVTARAKGLAETPVILSTCSRRLHPGGHPARAHVRGGGDWLVLRGVHLPVPEWGASSSSR